MAEIVPFENEMDAAPATGAKVGVPQPLVVALVGLATTMAPGKVGNISVKFKPLTAPALGLVKVNVSVETPLTLVGFGEKLFEMVILTGLIMTVVAAPAPAKKLLL